MALTPGTRLGPFEILAALNIPGLGEVYRARDHEQRRDVAMRVLKTDFGTNADRLRRFEQDARAAALLSHPNILTVHDIGTDAAAAYVISEPVEGTSLRDIVSRGAVPVRKVLQYGVQIAQGLAAAHREGGRAPRSEAGRHHRRHGGARSHCGLRPGQPRLASVRR